VASHPKEKSIQALTIDHTSSQSAARARLKVERLGVTMPPRVQKEKKRKEEKKRKSYSSD